MSLPHPHASVRASALALLADGNSPESVAHVLGVTADILRSWQQGGLDEIAAEPMPERSHVPAPPIEFATALVHRLPFSLRASVVAVCLFASAVFVALWHGERHESDGTGSTATMAVVAVVAGVQLGFYLLWYLRTQITFGPRGVSERRIFSTSPELRYADIEATTIAKGTMRLGRGSGLPGWRVTFNSSAPVANPPSPFFYDAYPVDPAIVERLRHLPGMSARDVAPLLDLPVKWRRRVPRWLGLVLIGVLLVGGIKLLMLPSLPFQQAWRGQPSLSQLDLVRGDLQSSSRCHRDPLFGDRGVEASIRLVSGAIVRPWIPCVMPAGVFEDGRSHVLGVHSWPQGGKPPIVYQVALDDRMLLSWETARAQQTAWLPLSLLAELGLVAAWVSLMIASGWLLDDERWAPG